MRWWKVALGAVLVLVAIYVAGGLLLPDRVQVERSIKIDRPPAEVYAVLDGFERFNEWSPWLDYDDTAVYRYSGPPRGVGARMEWQGEKGSGAQEIIEARAPDLIVATLDFGSDGHAESRYILIAEGAGTRLVWRFTGDFAGSFSGRWFGLMLERLIGPDYERGLRQLKWLVETPAAER